MRQIFGLLLFLISLFIVFHAYTLGLENKKCSCGCCPNVIGFPNTPMLYFKNNKSILEPIDLNYCYLLGCSAPRVPLYIDLLGVGGIFSLIGLRFLVHKSKSSII